MTKPKLRAVGPDEKAAKTTYKTIEEAAEKGTRLDELVQMRRRIARALDDANTSTRDLASLSRRQLEISKEIDVLKKQESEDVEGAGVGEDEDWNAEAV